MGHKTTARETGLFSLYLATYTRQPMSPSSIAFWASQPLIQFWEATFLMAGHDPRNATNLEVKDSNTIDLSNEEYRLSLAIENKQIQLANSTGANEEMKPTLDAASLMEWLRKYYPNNFQIVAPVKDEGSPSANPDFANRYIDENGEPLFRPVSTKGLSIIFTIKTPADKNLGWWREKAKRATSNGLSKARLEIGQGARQSMFAVDQVAEWLISKNELSRAHATRILRNNLPPDNGHYSRVSRILCKRVLG